MRSDKAQEMKNKARSDYEKAFDATVQDLGKKMPTGRWCNCEGCKNSTIAMWGATRICEKQTLPGEGCCAGDVVNQCGHAPDLEKAETDLEEILSFMKKFEGLKVE